MSTKDYEGKIKNIGLFIDQRIGVIRCLELEDNNIYFLAKDIERLLSYSKIKGLLIRSYYEDTKFILKPKKVKEFINSNLYNFDSFLLNLYYSVLKDIPNRGSLIINIDGVNMLISRSLIGSDRRKHQKWLYSYSNQFIQNDFYLR